MGDSTVRIVILGDSSSAERAARAVNSAFGDTESSAAALSTRLKKFGDGMSNVGRSLTYGVTLPLIGVAAKAIKTASDFQLSMNSMQAVAGVPRPQLEKLRDLAVEMGAKTVFSANEAAQAMLELSKAGVSTGQIMGGALKNSLDLATAGDLELAEAARIAANAMKVFGLSGRDSQKAADALAGAANASSADVSDLAIALSQGGLAAARASLSIQETTGVLAAFADAGLKGSDAGTSLKTFLLNLVPTSVKAKETMKELGVSFVDAAGNIKSIGDISDVLRDRLGGLTQAQQQVALKTMFGTDAFRAAAVIMDQGSEGLRKYTRATSEQGTAADVARGKMKGLPGAIETLRGSIETMLLTIGDRLAPTIKDAARFLTDLANKFSDLPVPMQETIVKIAAVAAALGPVLFVGGKLISMTGSIVGGFGKMASSFAKVGVAGGAARLGILGAATAVAGYFQAWNASHAAAAEMHKLWDEGAAGIREITGQIGTLSTDASNGVTKLKEAFGGLLGMKNATFQFNSEWETLTKTIESGARTGATATATIAAAQRHYMATIDETQERLERYGDVESVVASVTKIRETAERNLTRAMNLAAVAASETKTAEESLGQTRKRLTDTTTAFSRAELDSRDARRAVIDAQKTVNQLEKDGKKGTRAYQEAIDNLKRAKLDLRDASTKQTDALKELRDTLEGTANKGRVTKGAFMEFADAMGISREKANKLINDLPDGSRRLSDLADKLDLSARESATLHKAFEVLQVKARSSITGTVNEIAKIPGAIRTTQGEASSAARSVGNAIVVGIAGGIRAGQSAVLTAAVTTAMIAIDGAKRKLGIRSPSQVFLEIGRNITRGLAAGISSGLGTADRAMTQVISKITKKAESFAKDTADQIEKIQNQLSKALENDKLTKLQKSALRSAAQAEIAALRSTLNERQKVFRQLEAEGEKIVARIERLRGKVDDFQSSVRSGFDELNRITSFSAKEGFGDLTGAERGADVRSFLGAQLQSATKLSETLNALAARGLNKALLQQIAGEGMSAMPLAETLLGSKDLIEFANETMNTIDKLTKGVTESLTDRFFGEEMDHAQRELNDFAKAVERATDVVVGRFDLPDVRTPRPSSGVQPADQLTTKHFDVKVYGQPDRMTAADIARAIQRTETLGDNIFDSVR